jgi:hypothetical protein
VEKFKKNIVNSLQKIINCVEIKEWVDGNGREERMGENCVDENYEEEEGEDGERGGERK